HCNSSTASRAARVTRVPLSLGGSDVAAVAEAPSHCLNDIRPSCPQRGSLELTRRNSSDTLMPASSHEGSTRPRHSATALWLSPSSEPHACLRLPTRRRSQSLTQAEQPAPDT